MPAPNPETEKDLAEPRPANPDRKDVRTDNQRRKKEASASAVFLFDRGAVIDPPQLSINPLTDFLNQGRGIRQ